jgi:hypothetical protein
MARKFSVFPGLGFLASPGIWVLAGVHPQLTPVFGFLGRDSGDGTGMALLAGSAMPPNLIIS